MNIDWKIETPNESGDYWINQNGYINLGYYRAYDEKVIFSGDPFAYPLHYLNGIKAWAKVEYPATSSENCI